MAYTLPIVIRPDLSNKILSITKTKFHSITLLNKIDLNRIQQKSVIPRQFIHEINGVTFEDVSFLAIFNESKLIRFDLVEKLDEESGNNPFVTAFESIGITVSRRTAIDFYGNIGKFNNTSSNNLELFYEVLFETKSGEDKYKGCDAIELEKLEEYINFKIKKDKIQDYDFDKQDLTIHFKFSYENSHDIIQVIITRERNTWYGAIDFGSEASQMRFSNSRENIRNRNELQDIDINFIDIFKKILFKDKNTSKRFLQNDKFWQEDEEDPETLYRSIYPTVNIDQGIPVKNDFFLNNDDSKFNAKFLKVIGEAFLPNETLLPNIKLLRQLFVLLDNPKIRELNKIIKENLFKKNLRDDKIHSDIFPLLIANLLSAGILRLISDEKIKNINNDPRDINDKVFYPAINFVIRILVPNMYQSIEITELNLKLQEYLFELKSNLNTYIKKYSILLLNDEIKQKGEESDNSSVEEKSEEDNEVLRLISLLNGVEIMIMAEGDAVAIERNNVGAGFLKNAKKFVVIDCGKGTTDVSIFNKSIKQQVLDTVYRGGFAGAGNALSKAIYEDFITELQEINITRNLESIKQLIIVLKSLNDLKLSEKLTINLLFDGLKKSFFSSNSEEYKLSEDLGNPDSLLDNSKAANKEQIITQINSTFKDYLNRIRDKKFVFEKIETEDLKTEKTLNRIIDEIIYQMKIGGIKKNGAKRNKKIVIILSGRIFNSHDITKRFIEKIGLEFNLEINYNENIGTNHNRNFTKIKELKKLCIEGGVQETPGLNLNSDLNGIPMFLIKNRCLYKLKPVIKYLPEILRKKFFKKSIFSTKSLKISPHYFGFYFNNILPHKMLRDGNENKLILNRFSLKMKGNPKSFPIIELYYIGRGFLAIAKDIGESPKNNKYICQILEPGYDDFVTFQEDNFAADDSNSAKEIKDRYEVLLYDSFFPFI